MDQGHENDLSGGQSTQLRDDLARQRTELANERTLLAYARTSLASSVTGVGGIHLLAPTGWQILAWALALLGPFILAFGIWRFVAVAKAVR